MSNPFRTPGVREAIEAIGAKLRYCRRIRPDLNPIELVGGSPLHLVRADQIRPKEIGPGQLSRSGCGGRAPPLGFGANQ